MNSYKQIGPISISKAESFVFRAPIDIPVKTSFGTMYDRPSVLVRLEDQEGNYGWGETWCNFPNCGAEHRARLIIEVLIPLLVEQSSILPVETFSFLTRKSHILKIQCGEPGPIAQAIAGIDIAIWDLIARKKNKPLFNFLSNKIMDEVPVYASGIHPHEALDTLSDCRKQGYRSFKLKVGFGLTVDHHTVSQVIEQLNDDETLMLDANQAWNLAQAKEFVSKISNFPIQWLEEPLAADRPKKEWEELSSSFPLSLAGGENIRGSNNFADTISAGHITVIQPDACKWGGITGCMEVAKMALMAGKRYCPHYLGGGIGLLASAHILAAAGGDGLLEVDVNPNPLRHCLAMPHPKIQNGAFILPNSPGLGAEPNLKMAEEFLISTYRYQS